MLRRTITFDSHRSAPVSVTMGNIIGWIFGIIVLIVVLGAVSNCAEDTFKTEAEREAEKAKAAEDKRKGFHCLSSWDGSHRGFVRLVKDRMNDPDSFEHDKTFVGPVEAHEHTIRMSFRGRNAFGGLVRQTAYGTYMHGSCTPTLLFIQ